MHTKKPSMHQGKLDVSLVVKRIFLSFEPTK